MEKRYKVLEIDLQNGGREPIVGVDTVYESAAALLASEVLAQRIGRKVHLE